MIQRRSYFNIFYSDLKVSRIILGSEAHANVDIGLLNACVKRHPDHLILELDRLIYCMSLIIQTVEVWKLETRKRR
jgi:hypothetical protein